MKTPLVKVNASKNDSRKREINTYESKDAQKSIVWKTHRNRSTIVIKLSETSMESVH